MLEAHVVPSGWVPVYDVVRQEREATWQLLGDYIDTTGRATGLKVGLDALGCKIIRPFPGYGPTMGIVIEFDAPAQARGECCYRILFSDGDNEDVSEDEYRGFRRAFLKGSRTVP
jgi:hypothetical protein